MKSLLILQTLFLIFTSCNINCLKLKNGTFETTNADGSKTIITRNGNKQIESHSNGEIISEYGVKWLSDCEYILFSRKVIKGVDPWPGLAKDSLKIKILEVKKDYYLAEGVLITRGWPLIKHKVRILK